MQWFDFSQVASVEVGDLFILRWTVQSLSRRFPHILPPLSFLHRFEREFGT
jgi:hypothetical protein